MIVLGRISAPFGVRGWVRLQAFGDDPQAWACMPQWWLGADEQAPDAAWQERPLAECRPHAKGFIVRFEGIEDRAAAEKLAGLYAGVPREALPATANNEFYWADLIGLDVVNQEGTRLGRVAELLRSGAHEVLDVRDETGRQRLLPFVAAVVMKVDPAARLIRVDWGHDW
ncbi:MAG: ribosome maturation factor RimM [Rhodocyclaceae bacterium]|nr:ribosome maturation factor RimM [Rhodocyclaceae bacterium]